MNYELKYLHAFACDCRVGEGFWCSGSAEAGERMCSSWECCLALLVCEVNLVKAAVPSLVRRLIDVGTDLVWLLGDPWVAEFG